MASAAISRSLILVFGWLYPAYKSYKAIKSRSVSLYVQWMIYWIVFALFYNVETVADLLISWLPMYYEVKVIFVIWLLSPATQGSHVLYKMYIHPRLLKHEQEIEKTIEKVKSQSYSTLCNVGAQGMNLALQSAIAGQTKLADQLRKSYSFDSTDSVRQATDQMLQAGSVEGYRDYEEEEDEEENGEYYTDDTSVRLRSRYLPSPIQRQQAGRPRSINLMEPQTSRSLPSSVSDYEQVVYDRRDLDSNDDDLYQPTDTAGMMSRGDYYRSRNYPPNPQKQREYHNKKHRGMGFRSSGRENLEGFVEEDSESHRYTTREYYRQTRWPRGRGNNSNTFRRDNPSTGQPTVERKLLSTSASTSSLSQSRFSQQRHAGKATIARPVVRKPSTNPGVGSSSSPSASLPDQPATAETQTTNVIQATKPVTKPRFTESTLRYRTKKISDIKSHKINTPFVSIF